MPAAYIKKTGSNLGHTQKRGEADKFIFIEKEQGRYYIYDQTAKCYLYYTATSNGNSVKIRLRAMSDSTATSAKPIPGNC